MEFEQEGGKNDSTHILLLSYISAVYMLWLLFYLYILFTCSFSLIQISILDVCTWKVFILLVLKNEIIILKYNHNLDPKL